MEISVKLLEYKYHFAATITASLIMAIFATMAPDVVTIFSYFWPLFLSTALMLLAVMLFNQAATGFLGDEDGQGLLDFVAARPEMLEEY